MTRMSRNWSRRRRYTPPRSPFRKFLDYCVAFAILGLIVLIVARLDRVETRQTTGAAIVNDGDSITLGAERIRLRGIDAPEYTQTCQKDGADYPCGRRAREALARLVAGKSVSCSGWERDRYNRLLGVCTAGGVDLNRAQVEQGWAVAYGDYDDLEQAARQKGLGIWAGTFERPREWRDTHRMPVEPHHGSAGSMLNWLREMLRLS
ncbi:Endonuclease YncB, thermonuclease family [Mesorhizobium sp. YR577]|jgi:endonuclease YncB( thermonuclease family)|nr:Endonuclease YncB, thermonuclease family [Mesorhizobium sp. YR577]